MTDKRKNKTDTLKKNVLQSLEKTMGIVTQACKMANMLNSEQPLFSINEK